jgi:DNA-binding CsgD family transcriptional regulator
MDSAKLNQIVLELVQPHKMIFPIASVNILSKYFPDDTIVFLTGPTFELFTENTKSLQVQNSHYFYQPTFSTGLEDTGNLEEYWSEYAHEDPMQPSNLPNELRHSPAIRWSDLDEKRLQISEFWKKAGNPFGMTLYLIVKDICIGGVVLFHDRKLGDYSEEDYALLSALSQYIAPLYRTYIQQSFYAGITTILEQYYEPDSVGFTIITADAKPIMKNHNIDSYCDDILEYFSEQRVTETVISSGHSSIARVTRMLTKSYKPITQEVSRNLLIGSKRYKCKLTPCMMTGLSADIHMLFVLKITCESVRDVESRDFIKQLQKYNLTNREIEILKLVLNDFRNIDIVDKLNISESTVKTHIRNIYRKLGVNHRFELFTLFGQLN